MADNIHTKFYDDWKEGGRGGISGKQQDKSFNIVVENICTEFQDNPTIFRDSDEFGGERGANLKK